MTNPVDPETGAPLQRDVRPFTLAYKGASITIDMPGWYGDGPDEGVFDAEDTKVSDRVLKRLKARGWSSKDRRGGSQAARLPGKQTEAPATRTGKTE